MFARLDSNALAQHAAQLSVATHMPVQLVASIPSTNSALLNDSASLPLHPLPPSAMMALSQTAGRGRLGRPWLEPTFLDSSSSEANRPGSMFMASLGVRTHALLPSVGLLPLHIGIAIAEQLRAWGCPAQLKWPNDIMLATPSGSAKLGGILVESRSSEGGHAIVFGLGLNWHSAPELSDRLTACAAPYSPQALDAMAVTTALLNAMHLAWQRTVDGTPCNFAPFDALFGCAVTASSIHGTAMHGTAKGINAHGHLGVQTDSALVWLHSGEVSVRERA